jgi:hypothetical protein
MTRERCDAQRADVMQLERDTAASSGESVRFYGPCVLRSGAICTDLGDGWANRQCRALRSQCEALRERQGPDATPCVARLTF